MAQVASISVKMSSYDQILWGLMKDIRVIHNRVMSDIKHSVPGAVSDAVFKRYNINKSEVIATLAKQRGGEYHRGRNSGRGNTRFSLKGNSLDSLEFKFTAASWQYWDTWSKGLTKAGVKKAKKENRLEDYLREKAAEGHILAWKPKRGKRKNFRRKDNEKFWVKVETLRKKPANWEATDAYRVFTLFRGGNNRLAIAKKGEREYLMPKSSSIPQAILNEEVVAQWQPQIEKYIGDRVVHHCTEWIRGASYIR